MCTYTLYPGNLNISQDACSFFNQFALESRLLYLSTNHTPSSIAYILSVSERTVWCYISLFKLTGDIQPKKRRNGSRMLMSEFEQTTLLRLVLDNSGIYLQELQDELHDIFGVPVSVPAICRTLKYMGCTCQAMSRTFLYLKGTLHGGNLHL